MKPKRKKQIFFPKIYSIRAKDGDDDEEEEEEKQPTKLNEAESKGTEKTKSI